VTLVIPDPEATGAFLLAGKPLPRKTSDWMRILVNVLSYVATERPFDVSMLYVAGLPHESDIESVPFEHVPTANFYPLTPLSRYSEILHSDYDTIKRALHDPTAVAAWLVLHPAGNQRLPELEEPDGLPAASGALLLPGMPEIGLDHRAAWAAVTTDDKVATMNYTAHAKLTETVDLAALGALL